MTNIQFARVLWGFYAAICLLVSSAVGRCCLMLDQAASVGQKLSMLEVHADMLEACVRAGESDLDNSAVIREVRRRRSWGERQ